MPYSPRVATILVVGVLVGACGSAASPAPATMPPPSGPGMTVAPTTPEPTSTPTASPSASPSPGSANLGLHGSAREIGQRVGMAPGPGGTLFVSIPRPRGAVLALLDRSGRPRPGWPITIKDSTGCGGPMPAEDGSVRIGCDGTDLPTYDNDLSDVRAFAFDSAGRSVAGWPVRLRPGMASRVVGDQMTYLEWQIGTDTANVGVTISHAAWLTTIAADGSDRSGTRVGLVENCCREEWALSADGIAYGMLPVGERDRLGFAEESRITALDPDGERTGWPVSFDGIASGPAFGPDGQVAVTVGSFVRRTSRVLVFDRGGRTVSAMSEELPVETLALMAENDTDGCYPSSPRAPLVGQDGTIFVFSEVDTAVYALDPSMVIIRGWPFQPATPIVQPYDADPRFELTCPSFAVPAVGPDSTLYLPLQARDVTVGGSLVAVDRDGTVRPGWPVELKRPGAEFWSVVVGSDGTVYALAIEPETADGSSASILSIAPDSTVLSIATILEP